MPELYVNVDHIATLREARKSFEPSPLELVKLLEGSGVAGITTHLREDRRHIQDSDIFELNQYLLNSGMGFTFEMAATKEMRDICLRTSATMVTLVPESRSELTTEGGLDVITKAEYLQEYIKPLQERGKKVSLFIEPALDQIARAQEVGADFIEIHTGKYANLFQAYTLRPSSVEKETMFNLVKIELEQIKQAVIYARGRGLNVNLGHGLSLDNLDEIVKIPNVMQYHIGHSLISTSLKFGFRETCIKFLEKIQKNP